MSKAIILSAAVIALTLSPNVSYAKTIHLTYDGFCEGEAITYDDASGLYSTKGTECRKGVYAGIGTGPVNITGFGEAFVIGRNIDDVSGSYAGEYVAVFTYPFITGGKFATYKHADGEALTFLFSGTYTVTKGGAADSRHLPSVFERRSRSP